MGQSFIEILHPSVFRSPKSAVLQASTLRSTSRKALLPNREQNTIATHQSKFAISQQAEAKFLAAGRKPIHLIFEFCGLVIFLGWTASVARSIYERLLTDHVSRATTYPVALAIVLGIAVSDLSSGLIHWFVDNFGESDYPILGSLFFRPFHHHHVDPRAITTHVFIETNGNNCFISLPLIWAASSTVRHESAILSFAFTSFWISWALLAAFANQIHSWAHMKTPPSGVKILQDHNLLVSRKHHQIHHIRPHDRNYCLITGWMNRPLAAIRFFETAEQVIVNLTGVHPLHARVKDH